MNKFNIILLAGFILPATSVTGLPAISRIKHPVYDTIRLTDNSSGKTFKIRRGSTIILKLTFQPDGGYMTDSISYNKSKLRLIRHNQRPAPLNSTLGHSGRAFWKFSAFKPGKSDIKLTATRPWNKKDRIVIYKSVIIIK